MKQTKWIVAITICLVLGMLLYRFVFPIVHEGVTLYQNAVKQVSIAEYYEQAKQADDYVPYEHISDSFIEQLIESEDRRFFSHFGIDIAAICRALYHDVKAGALVEGGSTITQQLAKNMYFSFEKELPRKIAEVLVAFDLERALSKEEILELYCNIIYFGEGVYGIEAASQYYFGVSADALSDWQAAALVYTIRSPEYNNPHVLKEQWESIPVTDPVLSE